MSDPKPAKPRKPAPEMTPILALSKIGKILEQLNDGDRAKVLAFVGAE